MNTLENTSPGDAEGLDESSVVVLPSPNGQGISGQPTGFPSGLAVAPPPVVGASEETADANLSSRIEQVLAEDGRFTALVTGLTITADHDGTVHLAGPVPSDDRRRSLLATVHAIPGVTDVHDGLTVA